MFFLGGALVRITAMSVQLPTVVLVASEVVIGTTEVVTVATFLSVWSRWDACDLHTGIRKALSIDVTSEGQGRWFKPDDLT